MQIAKVIFIVLFWLSAFVIVWAMLGYNLSLRVLGKLFSKRKLEKNINYRPTVTVMAVAYNEEKVIAEKLNNMIQNDYPKDRIEYIIASDCSSDRTHEIVNDFIASHPDIPVRLIVAQNHKGKTNAQNEAQKFATGEILVMTDANSMFDTNSITELISSFTDKNIAYVSGRLKLINADSGSTANSENTYWEGDLHQREIESRIQTITAGNGAIYACRNSDYYDFEPIQCHDSAMPKYYAGLKKRAIYNPDAIAYEKAGETNEDEFKRKVRMNRGILSNLAKSFRTINFFKYGWFSYFYFGHRTCRYSLWLAHAILLISAGLLIPVHWFYALAFIVQALFYIVAAVNNGLGNHNRLLNMATYYCMTVLAQWKGVFNCITGKSKATWESAESTR